MDREKLLRKVRALIDKTVANGCTEAEAIAAAERAAELMRDNGISPADLHFEERGSPSRHAGKSQKARLWPVVAWCTNTSPIVLEESDGVHVAFIGREPGPQIAVYLRMVCERAVDAELARFKATPLYRRKRKLSVKRQVASAFVGGLIDRLCRRLERTFGPQVSKQARIEADGELDRRYPRTVDLAGPKRELRHWEARSAGVMAADRVNLAHGVDAGKAPLAIGRG